MQIIKRSLEEQIIKWLKPNKVVLLYGARRVGKTVLLKSIQNTLNVRIMMLNGEDYDTQNILSKRSIVNYKQLLHETDLLIIDEAQNIPEIGKILKLIVDEVKGIMVIASGSSAFDLLNKTGEPLVGRSTVFYLYPFSQIELSNIENLLDTAQNLENRLIYGTYPELVTIEGNTAKADYLRDITHAYLLKDILSIEGVRNELKMKSLLRLIAFQIGNEVSYDELGKQLGISKNTVEKYLDLLSKCYIIFKLSAYSRNLRKEISKAGKWYFYDNGIRNAVISNFTSFDLRQDKGALWENYLIAERIKRNTYLNEHKEIYFWRTYDRQEIDFIEEGNGHLKAFEFKWRKEKANLPVAFAKAYPNATFEVIQKDNYLSFIL